MSLSIFPLMSQLKIVPNSEEYYVLNEVSWPQYEDILKQLENNLQFRVSYWEGVLQVLSPSLRHEYIKTRLGFLLELYFLEKEVIYYPMGSATFRKQEKRGGIEPDESYCFEEEKEFPDLAIEIILSSGGVDSLVIYHSLGVREVWFWQKERLFIYAWRTGGYDLVNKSEILIDLDIDLLQSCLQSPQPLQAAQSFRDGLRKQ
jgi:Uma2 family endonuclease